PEGTAAAQARTRAATLSRTPDGGPPWARQHLAPPPGVPKGAETWLFPVQGPEVGTLLTLRAVSRRPAATRPSWEGTFGYARTGDGWTGPYRVPMPPASVGNDLPATRPDGRLWGAFGQDVWPGDNLAGPWQHRYVPLPDEESIADIYPVGHGVLWLTTTVGVAGGGLYRSDDDGTNWTRLTAAAT